MSEEQFWYLNPNTLIEENQDKFEDFKTETKETTLVLGRYKVIFTNFNFHPLFFHRSYGISDANSSLYVYEESKIKFFEDDILIKELDQEFKNPCIILHGDGQTRDGTKFTLLTYVGGYDSCSTKILNMNFELIRETLKGIHMSNIFDTDDDYFLTVADMPRNDPAEDPHLGIVKKSDFFDDDGTQNRTAPYDSYRTGLPTDGYGGGHYPAKVTKKALYLEDGTEVKYEDVADYDYDPENLQQKAIFEYFQSLGLGNLYINAMNSSAVNQALIDHGQVCIKLPEDEKKEENGKESE